MIVRFTRVLSLYDRLQTSCRNTEDTHSVLQNIKMELSRLPSSKLRDQVFAQEYVVIVSNRFGVLGMLEDPGELQDTFKREAPKCREKHKKTSKIREWICLKGNGGGYRRGRCFWLETDWNRTLSQMTITLLRKNKERCVRGLTRCRRFLYYKRPLTYLLRTLKKFLSKSISQMSHIRTADVQQVSGADRYVARWTYYFGHM